MRGTLHPNDKCYLFEIGCYSNQELRMEKGRKTKTHLFYKSERKYLQIFMGFLKSFPHNSPKYVFQDEQRS